MDPAAGVLHESPVSASFSDFDMNKSLPWLILLWLLSAVTAVSAEPRSVYFLTTVEDASGTHANLRTRLRTPANVSTRLYAEDGPVTIVGAIFDEEQNLVGVPLITTLNKTENEEFRFPLMDRRAHRLFLYMLDAKSWKVEGLKKLVASGDAARLLKMIADSSSNLKTGRGGEKAKDLGGVVITSASAANPGSAMTLRGLEWLMDKNTVKQSFSSNQERVVKYALKFQ